MWVWWCLGLIINSAAVQHPLRRAFLIWKCLLDMAVHQTGRTAQTKRLLRLFWNMRMNNVQYMRSVKALRMIDRLKYFKWLKYWQGRHAVRLSLLIAALLVRGPPTPVHLVIICWLRLLVCCTYVASMLSCLNCNRKTTSLAIEDVWTTSYPTQFVSSFV